MKQSIRRLTCVLVVLAAVATWACGGGDKGGARTDGAAPAEPAGRSDESAPPLRTNAVARSLAVGLLRFEDLPAGWGLSQESAGSPEDTDLCGTNLAVLERHQEKLGETGTAFERSASGPYLVETIAAYPPGVAQHVMADLTAIIQTCREVTIRDREGSLSTWELAPASFPPFGDETLAFREYWAANGVEALVVYVRRGDRIMTLLSIAINSRVDRLQLESLVSRAYERFLRLDGGR